MATLVDVAHRAEVSISTVSHVVNGTRPVRDETRQRVLAAIEKEGYEPDGLARALRRSKSDSVGLVIPDITNPFFAEVIDGLEAEARNAGFTVLLAHSNEDPERERASIAALLSRRVDGLIVGPAAGAEFSGVATSGVRRTPVVLLDRLGVSGVDQVGVESVDATRSLARHLASLGHRRIAMVAGVEGISTSDDRVAGYRLGLQDSGVEIDPTLIVPGMSKSEPAKAAVLDLMSRREAPTALVVGNNQMTLGALAALQEVGRRVPDDVAICAHDDFAWASLFSPRLTTVAQPAFAIGREAMRLLLRRLKHPDAPPRVVRLPPTIVHRESCGCAHPDLPIS